MLRAALLGLALLAQPALAQLESREGIALQNQILQLRQEMEQMRARGGGSSIAPPPSRGGGGVGNEMVGQLLDRVSGMEEETRRLRGRVDELDNRNRRLTEDLRKLSEDMEYRLGQREGAATPPAARPAPNLAIALVPRPTAPVVPPVATPATRTPERALSEGQAALRRQDFTAAEAAAREALSARAGAQQANAQLLLGDALAGRRDFGNAAIAYNEAYARARTSPRAPEALLGLAASFTGLGSKREACDTLGDLRSSHPNLSPGLQQRAEALRARAGCR